MYQIFDGKTKKQVGTNYKDRKKAQTRANNLDLSYGAVRYFVKKIYEESKDIKICSGQ
jgi:hypothetical protein